MDWPGDHEDNSNLHTDTDPVNPTTIPMVLASIILLEAQ